MAAMLPVAEGLFHRTVLLIHQLVSLLVLDRPEQGPGLIGGHSAILSFLGLRSLGGGLLGTSGWGR